MLWMVSGMFLVMPGMGMSWMLMGIWKETLMGMMMWDVMMKMSIIMKTEMLMRMLMMWMQM